MKKIILFIIAIFMCLSLIGCKSTNDKTYIGIISAMDNEISLLLEEATIEEEKTIGGVTFYICKINDKSVVISRSGIGKINASSGVTLLLNNFNISKVIFTGIAGGTRNEESVLDEVIGTSVVEHDYGFITDEGLVWGGGDPGKKEPGEYYYCDSDLVNLAYEAALSTITNHKVFKGLIATGDQFIASSEYVQTLVNNFDAYACEMEGAAIAKVCKTYGKPFVIIRTLSDKADGEAHDSYENFGDESANQSCNIVLKMLELMK